MSNKSNTTATTTNVAAECARLRVFKEFLNTQKTVALGELNATTASEAVIRSRANKDATYRVTTVAERDAEVIYTLWTQLQQKGCPRWFQIKLLHAAAAQLEFHNAKECEITPPDNDDAELPQYDLLKLQKFINEQLEKLLNKLADNSAADQLKNYADDGVLCNAKNASETACNCAQLLNEPQIYAVAQIKNKPRKMEDRHICLEHFGDIYRIPHAYSFYGVFDGHSGALSACYATSQLPKLLAKELQTYDNHTDSDVDFYRQAFETAFLRTDEQFAKKRITSGTTAVCALLTAPSSQAKRMLYVAWIGDSKALLVGQKASLQLVKPHKPDALDERRRIEAAGGSVIHAQGQWRVNGILNVARSIGDYCVEPVIAEPDFVDVELSQSAHDFLILASDGLWDHVEESAVAEIVYTALCDATRKFEDIPKLLIEAAKEGDSLDNITAIVVLLKTRTQIVEEFKSKNL